MHEMTIGEVARQAGIQTSTLRYYERVALLSRPRRVNGQRRYDASVLQTLTLIHIAQQAGFTIAEIQTLLTTISKMDAPSAQWQALAQRKLQEVNNRLRHILNMKRLLEEVLRCDYPQLVECICDVGEKHGVLTKGGK